MGRVGFKWDTGQSVLLSTPFSGLQNNSQPETFPLRHSIDGHVFPCKFIKISKNIFVL